MLDAPGRPGDARPLRGAAGGRVDALGRRASRCPRAPRTVTGPHPGGPAIGLSVQVRGRLASRSQRAVITVAGQPYELAGSLSSALVPGPWQLAGFSQGYAVFTLRKPPEPIVASTGTGRPAARRRSSRARRSPSRSRVQAPAPSTVDPFGRLGLGVDAQPSRSNGGKAEAIPVHDFDLVQQVHIPAGDDVVTRSTTGRATSCWRASSASARSPAPVGGAARPSGVVTTAGAAKVGDGAWRRTTRRTTGEARPGSRRPAAVRAGQSRSSGRQQKGCARVRRNSPSSAPHIPSTTKPASDELVARPAPG